MNKIFIVALSLVIGSSILTASAAEEVEIRASGVLYAPSGAAATGSEESGLDDVEWDSGQGLELQGIYWVDKSQWGIGATIGTASWDIKDYADVKYNPTVQINQVNVLEGDADLLIFGISAFRKLTNNDPGTSKFNADAELGLRYISVDSGIEGGYGEEYSDALLVALQTLEIDDSIVGVIGLTGDYAIDNNLSIFANASIQIDLDKGSVDNVLSIGTFEAGEVEFMSLYGKAGISYVF